MILNWTQFFLCLLLLWAFCNDCCVFKSLNTSHMKDHRTDYVFSYVKRLIMIANKHYDFGTGGKEKASQQS